MVSDIHRKMLGNQEGGDDQHRSVSDRRLHPPSNACSLSPRLKLGQQPHYYWIQYLTFVSSITGESPPPAPRACFGRDKLISEIVDQAEDLQPIALIGPGGIGKTSIALTVLHHPRIKKRFGDNRRFIRCDQFPPSCTRLLSRLSEVIGAEIKNPEDLTSLRPFLSSKKMLIVLDNAESILDPSGSDAKEIYAVVVELSQLDDVCLCITSRISAVPPDCETFDIPPLSIGAARNAFCCIYKNAERSNLVDKILVQLDFHPLSITLLATVAHQNKWDIGRLTKEWEKQRTRVLHTAHNESLAATIGLSLASPMFRDLGPDARDLLGIVAFFPQGVDENNLDWLFPTVSNRTDIFDKFCVLSLTSRSYSFVTMLAPLRDHLRPGDPESSSLLRTVKKRYFTRMAAKVDPNNPGFGETRWIMSEDVNIENLLDVFTTIDADSDDVWDACANFIKHLTWHKKRRTILGPKIEGLPDDHRSKPNYLFELSRSFCLVGDHVERKRLLIHALQLEREWGDDHAVARILKQLSGADRDIGHPKTGIRLAKEALEIFERLGDTVGQADCLMTLASLLESKKRLDDAEEAASRAIELLSGGGKQHLVCESHRTLAYIYHSKGEIGKAIHQFEKAHVIASSLNLHDQSFLVHHGLADLFINEDRFDEAQAHIEHAKSFTSNSVYYLGGVMGLQAKFWYREDRLEEARSEALRATEVFEYLGAAGDLRTSRRLLRRIEKKKNKSVILDELSDSGEPSG